MTIIVFHRSHSKKGNFSVPTKSKPAIPGKDFPSLPANIEILGPAPDTPLAKDKGTRNRTENLSEFSYQVKEVDKSVRISIEAKYQGEIPIKETVRVPQQPWSIFHVFLQPDTGKIEIVSLTTFTSRNNVEYPQQNYIAKVLTTDTETLLYLRGRIPNIKGFKNITVEEGQDSATAFRRYSSKVKRFQEELNERKRKLGTIDLFKQLGYLEAQIDVLTEIIVEAGLARDKRLLGFLEASRQYAIQKNVSLDKLRERLNYKQRVRGVDSFY